MCGVEFSSKKTLKQHIWLERLIRQDERFKSVEPENVRLALRLIITAVRSKEFVNGPNRTQIGGYIGEKHRSHSKLFSSLQQDILEFGKSHGILVESNKSFEYRYSVGPKASGLVDVEGEVRADGKVCWNILGRTFI